MYNFENYLFHPIFSLITGVFLVFSISMFGFFFINTFFKKFVIKNPLFIFNSPLVGSNLLIFILTPISYLELHSFHFFRIFSIILFIFSIYISFKHHRVFKKIKFNKNYSLLYMSN